MKYFTNKQGEKVELSKEHLDTAVYIKKELQKASPSFRCSWTTHTKLMHEEEFLEAETSERYRKAILDYQRSIGELDTVGERENKVASSKLASIKEAVGDMYYVKREVQLESQKLGKIKREVTLYGVIAEQVREAILNDLNQIIPSWVYKEVEPFNNGSRMVVLLSDLHIGAIIDNVLGNSYNYNIAKKRMQKFYNNIVDIGVKNGVSEIDVVVLGDICEHLQMRKSQGFHTEFTLAEQITKAYELIRDFLVNLSEYFVVSYRGVSGNHDRMEGNKDDNIDGDSTVHVVNYFISQFIKDLGVSRIHYYEVDDIDYSTSFEVNGVKIKAVHGDNEKGNKKLAVHGDMDNDNYNILVMGHLHHYNVKEVGQDKYEVYVGSLQGANNYGKKGKFLSNASQGIILIGENGDIDIRRIDLQKA